MRFSRPFLFIVALFTLTSTARAAIQTKEIDYEQGGTPLQGYLAWDDAAAKPRPGVLIVHEWWGHNAHARHQAERLAQAGYVAFALDMYGKGKVATHPDSAEAFMMESMKAGLVPARFDAALEQLKAQPMVDSRHIGAIGYCFGGGVVLGMARAGAPLTAVATFHGSLATEKKAKKGAVKAKILVNTGMADPLVPESQVADFEREMKAAGAKIKVIRYPGAKHSFTNPDAATYGMPQLEYNADADAKSWEAMLKFFKKTLK